MMLVELWNEYWPLLSAMLVVLIAIPTLGLYMTYIERKVAAAMQDRIGPNRVGPLGLLQAVADGLKIFLKEQVVPAHVDKWIYLTAPAIGVVTSMLAFAVVPFGPVSPEGPHTGFRFIIAPGVEIGLVFIFAVSSLSAYAIILGGWASNNKYSLYGAIRSCAQFISYEIPLGMSVLGVFAITGSMNLEKIVYQQSSFLEWNIWWQPLAALIFFTSALAESNRLPFDLSECEQELVGGFHTEYSGIKFVLFFLAEYTHVVTISFLTVLLFFGGWHFPGLTDPADPTVMGTALRLFVLLGKVGVVVFFIMMLRWTLPRFRFDQLMGLAWKGFIPLSLFNLLGVMIVVSLDLSPYWMTLFSLIVFVVAGALNVSQLNNRLRSPSSTTAIRARAEGAY
jgi:NADH-quinone oxidoreductase subunit H